MLVHSASFVQLTHGAVVQYKVSASSTWRNLAIAFCSAWADIHESSPVPLGSPAPAQGTSMQCCDPGKDPLYPEDRMYPLPVITAPTCLLEHVALLENALATCM